MVGNANGIQVGLTLRPEMDKTDLSESFLLELSELCLKYRRLIDGGNLRIVPLTARGMKRLFSLEEAK